MPQSQITKDESRLLLSRIIALFIQSALWGVLAVVYFLGVRALLSHRQPHTLVKRNWLILSANTGMFVLATIHLSLTVNLAVLGFVDRGDTREAIYDVFDLVTPTNVAALEVAQYYTYVTQTLIGDGFMVYRLFVVWNRTLLPITLPVILFIIGAIIGYANWRGPQNMVLTAVFYFFSFFSNILSSVLILWRVLRSTELIEHTSGGELYPRKSLNHIVRWRVLEALIQSAAVYSAASVALVVTCFVDKEVEYFPCLSFFSPFIGIVFSVMGIQIAHRSAVRTTGVRNAIVSPPGWMGLDKQQEVREGDVTGGGQA